MITSKNSEKKKISLSNNRELYVICFGVGLSLGKWFKMSRFDCQQKLALELDVSMDELISDEDVNDMQVNYGIWKSERIQNRMRLQEFRQKLLNFMEILGTYIYGKYSAFRVQLERIYHYGLPLVSFV